jgi:hypothetical protein
VNFAIQKDWQGPRLECRLQVCGFRGRFCVIAVPALWSWPVAGSRVEGEAGPVSQRTRAAYSDHWEIPEVSKVDHVEIVPADERASSERASSMTGHSLH